MSDKLALEIGPGQHPAAREGDGYSWVTLDYPAFNWGVDRIPACDGKFSLVYASHVLEHVPWNRTAAALSEVFRVLKRGGRIELWVPNFRYLVFCYLERRCGDDWRHDNPNDDPMVWLNGRLFTYGPEPNYHKSAFDDESLTRHLQAIGFESASRLDPSERERGHKHGIISLGMRATKP